MKFFLDENFPKAAIEMLGGHGYTSIDVRGTISEGASDQDIFAMAQEQGAVFLTTDRDFFHTVPYLYPSHHGVVVIALRQPNRSSILARLSWFLDKFQERDLTNRVFELKDRTYRVFPAE